MKKGEHIEYKGLAIYLNEFDEYCACYFTTESQIITLTPLEGGQSKKYKMEIKEVTRMITADASRRTLKAIKEYIDKNYRPIK